MRARCSSCSVSRCSHSRDRPQRLPDALERVVPIDITTRQETHNDVLHDRDHGIQLPPVLDDQPPDVDIARPDEPEALGEDPEAATRLRHRDAAIVDLVEPLDHAMVVAGRKSGHDAQRAGTDVTCLCQLRANFGACGSEPQAPTVAR